MTLDIGKIKQDLLGAVLALLGLAGVILLFLAFQHEHAAPNLWIGGFSVGALAIGCAMLSPDAFKFAVQTVLGFGTLILSAARGGTAAPPATAAQDVVPEKRTARGTVLRAAMQTGYVQKPSTPDP